MRNFWTELGVTQKDIAVPLASLYSHNIKIIDDDAPRIAFIRDPVALTLVGVNETVVEIPTHPNTTNLGTRKIELRNPVVFVEREDLGHQKLRLKEFGDFDIEGNQAHFLARERTDKRKIIHWTSKDSSIDASLRRVIDGEVCSVEGKLEAHQLPVNTPVQIERIGYGIIAAHNEIVFTHD